MTISTLHFILFMIGFTIFVFIFVPLLKILVMADVFGWKKTKELLRDDTWSFPTHKSVQEKLKKAEAELHDMSRL